MGWMVVLGECYVCGRRFTFSAERVPSVVVHGEREPICEPCIEHVNRVRARNGLALFPILPGAYAPDEVP